MTKLLIAAATALGIALAGVAPAMAASTTTSGTYQVAQASTDAPKAKKGKKKAAKKAEGGEKKAAKKAKGKKKTT